MITPAFIALTLAAVRVTLAVPVATPVLPRGAIGPQFWPGQLPSSPEDPILVDREPGAIGPQFFGPGFLPDPVTSEAPQPTFTGGPIGPQFFPGSLPTRELNLGPLGLGGLGPAQAPDAGSGPELGPLGLGGLGPAQSPDAGSGPELGPLGLGGLGPAQAPQTRELKLGPLGLGGLGPAQAPNAGSPLGLGGLGPAQAPNAGSPLGLGGLGPAQAPQTRELKLGPLGLGGLGPAQAPNAGSPLGLGGLGPAQAPNAGTGGPLGLGGLGPAQAPSAARRMVRVRAPTPDSLVSRDAIKVDFAAAQAAQQAAQQAQLQQQQQNEALQALQNGGANVDPSVLEQFQADDKAAASLFQRSL